MGLPVLTTCLTCPSCSSSNVEMRQIHETVLVDCRACYERIEVSAR